MATPRRVVIFQPSVAPFVQQAARALAEAEWLEKFYTTLFEDKKSSLQSLARAAHLVSTELLARRRISEIPSEKVVGFPTAEIARLVAGRMDRSGRWADIFWERGEQRFARNVARTLRPEISAVYGYEFSSLAAFERARELELKIFYDVPAPAPEFTLQLLAAEMERFPELQSAYTRHTAAREERRTAHRKREFALADRVIAASRFTRDSFPNQSGEPQKIVVVPYGAPPPAEVDQIRPRSASAPLRLIWAGTFSVRKGAHYLIEAWRRGKFAHRATLDVFGTVTVPDRVIKPVPDGITFRGPVARETLFEEFRHADALVFPTLCDGFGMVATEAWSQGLPVITTARAGAADLLRPDENGFLVEPGNAESLLNCLETLVTAPARARALRDGALQTAARWQWSDYRRALIDQLEAAF